VINTETLDEWLAMRRLDTGMLRGLKEHQDLASDHPDED
jgi:hypothetical protein